MSNSIAFIDGAQAHFVVETLYIIPWAVDDERNTYWIKSLLP